MEFLYVLSKDMGGGQRLIGKLYKVNNDKFKFTYCLGEHKTFPEWFLQIEEFPEIDREYAGEEMDRFVDRIIPKKNNMFIDVILEQYSLTEYDRWKLLKREGKNNQHEDAFLYEELPTEVIKYG